MKWQVPGAQSSACTVCAGRRVLTPQSPPSATVGLTAFTLFPHPLALAPETTELPPVPELVLVCRVACSFPACVRVVLLLPAFPDWLHAAC